VVHAVSVCLWVGRAAAKLKMSGRKESDFMALIPGEKKRKRKMRASGDLYLQSFYPLRPNLATYQIKTEDARLTVTTLGRAAADLAKFHRNRTRRRDGCECTACWGSAQTPAESQCRRRHGRYRAASPPHGGLSRKIKKLCCVSMARDP
jgi:hypothetical protein